LYEEKYFVGDHTPILFGYDSIFYRVNAWFRFRRIASIIRKFGGRGKVLDVGCALGHSVGRFSSIGLQSVGCDISAWATKHAKQKYKDLDVIRAGTPFLPFRRGAFDVTTTFETLEHCADLNSALREINRVTKLKGLVVVSVPTTDLNDTYGDKSHMWHMSLKEWLDLFENYFEVLAIEFL
jgi:ubiquinone/menaquinone biosynthesis C-methylase UbiE